MKDKFIIGSDGSTLYMDDRVEIEHEMIGRITGVLVDIDKEDGVAKVVHIRPDYNPDVVLKLMNDLITEALPATITATKPVEDIMVAHPPHYQSETGLEVIDVIEAFTFDLKGIEATDTGNIIKYICRWKHKNGLQDLEKAKWYLEHLIAHVEKLEEENKPYETQLTN